MAVLALAAGCATTAPVPLGGRLDFESSVAHSWGRRGADREIPQGTPRPAGSGPAETVDAPAGARGTVVTVAQKLVGQRRTVIRGHAWGDDCTGLVRGVYAQVGVDLMTSAAKGDNGVTAIWRYALSHGRVYEGGRPVAGDLVFFRDTYDLNRDGLTNDGLTHIGLVETIEDDGTVLVIHRVARGIVRYRMNLTFKDQPRTGDGRVVNDALRPPKGKEPLRLASQLFAGYATLLPIESRLASR